MECKSSSGSCKKKPQFCSVSDCLSDTVAWTDPALPGLVQRGCSYIEGDKFIHHKKARCALRAKAKLENETVIVDTATAENMLECSEWSDTQECSRKLLHILPSAEVLSESIDHQFMISPGGCSDGSIQLEILDALLTPTQEFLTHSKFPFSVVEAGSNDPKTTCFKVHYNLCGPDSITFESSHLFMTACHGLLQMNPEHEDCGSKYNQCWRTNFKSNPPATFKFLIYNEDIKLVASDDEELAKLIEKMMKANEFLFNIEFSTPSFITARCLEEDTWEFLNESLKYAFFESWFLCV